MKNISSQNCKIKNKKSQIQMGESIAVTIIVIVMIVIGLAIYSSFTKNKKPSEASSDLLALRLASTISEMPELHCTNKKINCFDLLKMSAFIELMNQNEERLYYYSLIGNAKITITQVLPNSTTIFSNEIINLYEKNSNYTTKKQVFIPVNLYNPYTKSVGFGILTVERYS